MGGCLPVYVTKTTQKEAIAIAVLLRRIKK